MKKILLSLIVVLLNVVFLSFPAAAQPQKPEAISAHDLLIKSEVETAVSMLQAVYTKELSINNLPISRSNVVPLQGAARGA